MSQSPHPFLISFYCFATGAISQLNYILCPNQPTPAPVVRPTPEPTPGPSPAPTPGPTPGPTGPSIPEIGEGPQTCVDLPKSCIVPKGKAGGKSVRGSSKGGDTLNGVAFCVQSTTSSKGKDSKGKDSKGKDSKGTPDGSGAVGVFTSICVDPSTSELDSAHTAVACGCCSDGLEADPPSFCGAPILESAATTAPSKGKSGKSGKKTKKRRR